MRRCAARSLPDGWFFDPSTPPLVRRPTCAVRYRVRNGAALRSCSAARCAPEHCRPDSAAPCRTVVHPVALTFEPRFAGRAPERRFSKAAASSNVDVRLRPAGARGGRSGRQGRPLRLTGCAIRSSLHASRSRSLIMRMSMRCCGPDRARQGARLCTAVGACTTPATTNDSARPRNGR